MAGRSPLDIDLANESRRIAAFIERTVASAKARGVVVGLSGGIDSAVVGDLCVKALGTKRVLAALLPSEHTPVDDMSDARKLVQKWGIGRVEIPIMKPQAAILSAVGDGSDKLASANIQARIRMTIVYFLANSRKLLVAGTGDRSESEIGYFSKWGDGGVDFLPIAHLYKTQVRRLGEFLGLPKRIVTKPPSPQLWLGHKATDEIPVDYDKLDPLLYYLLQQKKPLEYVASKVGVPVSVVRRVQSVHDATAHKRVLPPSLKPV